MSCKAVVITMLLGLGSSARMPSRSEHADPAVEPVDLSGMGQNGTRVGNSGAFQTVWDKFADHLEQAEAEDSAIYHECMVEAPNTQMRDGLTDDSDPGFMKRRCNAGSWSGIEGGREMCDRVELRLKGLLGETKISHNIDSSRRFCAALATEVVPIADEPFCLTFMDDVSLAFAFRNAGDTSSSRKWPQIMRQTPFKAAFQDACKVKGLGNCDERYKWVTRDMGRTDAHRFPPNTQDFASFVNNFCQMLLPEHAEYVEGASGSAACPSGSQPLTLSGCRHRRQLSRGWYLVNSERDPPYCFRYGHDIYFNQYNPRGRRGVGGRHVVCHKPHTASALFEYENSTMEASQASISALHDAMTDASQSNESAEVLGGLVERSQLRTLSRAELTTRGAASIMDEAINRKTPRQPRSGLTKVQRKLCCAERAEQLEFGVSAAGGVVVGSASVGVGLRGWDGWEEEHKRNTKCIFKEAKGQLSACVGFAPPSVGLSVSMTKGYFNSFSDIPGESRFLGGEACFGICFGGGIIENLQGQGIGRYWSSGFGLGYSIDVGVCSTALLGKETETRISMHRDDDCPKCFPADATVRTSKGRKTMEELQVGDRVLATDQFGRTFFDEVYFFGHAEAAALTPMQKLVLSVAEQELVLHLSSDHFLPACPVRSTRCAWSERVQVYSRIVMAGDFVWVSSPEGDQVQLARVHSTAVVLKTGLYNPYTLSGSIIVDGAVASVHSSWILDSWMSAKDLPGIYQALFWPGRLLYSVVGRRAAEALDMANPQTNAESFGHGPKFLLGFALTAGLLLVGPFAKLLSISKAS